MRGFLLANLFLFGIVLVAAILAGGAAAIAKQLHAPAELEVWITVALAAAAVFATFYISLFVYRILDVRVNRAR